jgi:hypothetical protein
VRVTNDFCAFGDSHHVLSAASESQDGSEWTLYGIRADDEGRGSNNSSKPVPG